MKFLPCFLTSNPTADNFDEEDDELRLDVEDDGPVYEPRPAHSGSLKSSDSTLMGQKVLSFILIILGSVIALPTLFIYLFKSPPPLQDVFTFGVSYYKLLFILNLCAVMLMVSTIAFTVANFPVISATFIICLFCSIPLIVGLRQDMTMQQAMLEISFFSGWPFFIRPLYILTALLFPAGILFFLFLQIKTVFSRKPHTYAFGGAALFLALATFFGTYELSRAGQPTVQTALHLQQATEPVSSDGLTHQSESPGALATLPSAVAKERQPLDLRGQNQSAPSADTADQVGATDQTAPLTTTPPNPVLKASPSTIMSDGVALEGIERKLGTLIDSLNAKVNSFTLLQAKAEEERQAELAALDGRVGALSGKLDAILLQMENKIQNQSQPPEKQVQAGVMGQGTALTETIPVPLKTDKALANVNKQIDTLIEKVQSIEIKTRDVP